ncbi:MAG: TlpA family protein disulfide reductase [Anaerolineales bacterium]
MQKTKLTIGILLLTALLLAACSGGQTANNVMDDMSNDSAQSDNMMNDDQGNDMANDSMDDSMDDTNDDMMDNDDDAMMEDIHENMDDNMSDDMSDDSMDSGMVSPDFFGYEFEDAVTGEKFSINQFKGQVVLVENMATWCSNCLKQQGEVKEFLQMLGERDDFVMIGISIELDMDPVRLGMYVENYGFDWLYGIADQSVQQSIQASLGGQFLNPPATPIFLVDKNGSTHELPLGTIKTADELLAFVEPFLN